MNTTAKLSAGKAASGLLLAAVVVAAIAAGGYWWWNRGADRPPAGPPEVITLAASVAYPGSSLIAIAGALGHFRAEGLQVAILEYPTGKECLDAVIAGKADFGTVADIPFMFATMRDAPVVVLATMATTSGEENAIVVRRDRGIASIAALKGKRVGVTFGTSGHYFLDGMLVRQHLTSSQVRLADLAPGRMAGALAAGEVDAVASWEPYVGAARKALGPNGETFAGAGIYETPWLLVARRETAAKRAEAVRRALRALVRAERYYAEGPGEAQALIAGLRKEQAEGVKSLLEPFRFNVRLGQSLLGALEDEARWAIRNKLVERTSAPNFLDHFHLDGMLAVRPEAMTVIH